ncbi:NADH dehydrogenase (quinone) [Desulfotomaculum nigrificans CO-1-SRB]|uniref:NADH dehydrogenase (Quinone) n=1 Tax=Desulfotomaculum nigrificans (strain DSM 14880 / VKM B-2319 / CO-1-SRB) TaxID=868595 RepID=F6B436_DESCC|nr:NADH-quinone oxidoreductase subunit NuoF [Desulfotomaculum nigrificans]AEF94091.1 NADH dehydrogenase (quinone) [Desulfotomaculum nigrificans CO-1-SRB]
MLIKSYEDLENIRQKARVALEQYDMRILVCAGTGCVANGSLKIYEKLKKMISEKGLLAEIELVKEVSHEGIGVNISGCHGFCQMGPLVRFEPSGLLYVKVKEEDVEEIVNTTVIGNGVVERLLYVNPKTGEKITTQDENPFYKRQVRVTLRYCGRINPEDIYDYIAHRGYRAIAKVLNNMTPQDVINEVTESGLRGRGGGGFPTGRKWSFAAASPGTKKYIICNGDEGDPGAFMDRSVMEGNPHSVIEGMMIAGYAIGADEGYIYARAEYPLAIQRMRKAITDAEAIGLLGNNILGSNFNFKIHIKEGAGAFVCGEETALIASIEGQRGMPRPRPPFPAVKGLWGCPTVINNVETLANLRYIINNGAALFKSYGTNHSAGTKTFALAGQIQNTGLVEVPMGITLREIVFDIGGGLREGKKYKAVQIGGPSGGCLTEEKLDLPLDYDELIKAGAMIGSGGLVVMGDDTCMVETAKFFMSFVQNESCGKCVPCREGTKQMLALLTKITEGKGTEEDLVVLEELAHSVKDGSLCGLGKTAPNPVLTTLRYFRDEYIAHVRDKKCPAGACQALKEYYIDPEKCKGCTLCSRVCPAGAITGEKKQPHEINVELCLKCGTCAEKCKFGAISTR